ncbi:MAG: hypothetical protein ABH859_08615 [Pseudomonadota bacterium]
MEINKLINIISFAVLMITLIGVLYSNQMILVPLVSAKTDIAEGQTSYSIRCVPSNELSLVSHFNIMSTFNNQLGSTLAVTNSETGQAIISKSVKETLETIENEQYQVAMFEGPKVSHHAFCANEQLNHGNLHMAQISKQENPPILMAQGSETNIDNFQQVPNNGQFYNAVNNGSIDKINFGLRATYGEGSSNNYRVAVTKPLNSDQQSYVYEMLVSSNLE